MAVFVPEQLQKRLLNSFEGARAEEPGACGTHHKTASTRVCVCTHVCTRVGARLLACTVTHTHQMPRGLALTERKPQS